MSAKLPTVNEPPDLPLGGAGAGVGTGVGSGVAVGSGAGVASGTVVGAGAGTVAVAVAAGTGVLAGAATVGGAGAVVGVGVVEVQAKNSRVSPPMTKNLAFITCLIPPLLNRPQRDRLQLPQPAARMIAANYRGTWWAGIS
tara:strand:- start:5426 stop:5848 length:423 start_codon:yes stop_codon:yes gene_type:complete